MTPSTTSLVRVTREYSDSLNSLTSVRAAAVAARGASLARLNDEEFLKLPDDVERPRGPADYFRLTQGGRVHYVVVCDGAPYVFYKAAV